MTDKSVINGKDEKGRFTKGNHFGCILKRGYSLLDITKAAMRYDETHDGTIMKKYIDRVTKNDRMLENFVNRYVPAKTVSEFTGVDGSPLTFIIEKTYKQEEVKDSKEAKSKE